MGKLFTFHGRGGRGRLWLGFFLSYALLLAPVAILAAVVGPAAAGTEVVAQEPSAVDVIAPILVALFAIAAVVMQIATGVTRCHDRGKSGFWMLLILVPVVGFIWWLVDLGILEGEEGPNKYGPPITV